jgi:protein gp37
MADRSAVEWSDATWNPVRGGTKVSPGCKQCYAERFAERFRGGRIIRLHSYSGWIASRPQLRIVTSVPFRG